MLVDDGTVKQLNVEAPGKFEVSTPARCSGRSIGAVAEGDSAPELFCVFLRRREHADHYGAISGCAVDRRSVSFRSYEATRNPRAAVVAALPWASPPGGAGLGTFEVTTRAEILKPQDVHAPGCPCPSGRTPLAALARQYLSATASA